MGIQEKKKSNSSEDRKGTSNWISKEKEDKKRIEMDLRGEGNNSGSLASLQQLWESENRCLEPGLSETQKHKRHGRRGQKSLCGKADKNQGDGLVLVLKSVWYQTTVRKRLQPSRGANLGHTIMM